ncbi:MAG: winged helix-turn-helix domain-containing protein [Streptosporangiales bacterium]|nr:winged helix-turn-helix domain-containing protein [Streptosporangiales bacterium]
MSKAPRPQAILSRTDARRLALRAQGLYGPRDVRDTGAVLRRLGAVQLDTISVLARSHELVPYARLGAVGRPRVERAYWAQPPRTFEYWSHAACILPLEEWPHYAFRRRERRAKGRRWHQVHERTVREVHAQLRAEGPLSATDLGGAKKGGPWWDWSDVKIAVEWLLDIGDAVCVERRGWRRIYELSERAVPAELRYDEDDETCLTRLVAGAGRAMGVAAKADLADYVRVRIDQVEAVLPATGLVPVAVEGWSVDAWADPDALADTPTGRCRTTLLSPFDSLVWDRRRTERLFDFTHRLEAYVPRPKRIHGYFAMPLLTGGELAGRVDPARENSTVVARQVSLARRSTVGPMATALREAARWVGCDDVRVEQVTPAHLAEPLRLAVKRA